MKESSFRLFEMFSPLLSTLSDKKSYKYAEINEFMKLYFDENLQNKTSDLPSFKIKATFDDLVKVVITLLKKEGYISLVEDEGIQITEKGLETLHQSEEYSYRKSNALLQQTAFLDIQDLLNDWKSNRCEKEETVSVKESIEKNHQKFKSDLLYKIQHTRPNILQKIISDFLTYNGYTSKTEESPSLFQKNDDTIFGVFKNKKIGEDKIFVTIFLKPIYIDIAYMRTYVEFMKKKGCKKGIFITPFLFYDETKHFIADLSYYKIKLIDGLQLVERMVSMGIGCRVDFIFKQQSLDSTYFI